MKKRRFLAKCPRYGLLMPNGAGGVQNIIIDNIVGLETDDEHIINAITTHPDFRVFLLEVETQEELQQAREAERRKILGLTASPKQEEIPLEKQVLAQAVEPLSVPDPEEEKKKFEAEQAERRKEAEAAEKAKAEKRAEAEAKKEEYKDKKAAAAAKRGQTPKKAPAKK